jgi:hypothetical protein
MDETLHQHWRREFGVEEDEDIVMEDNSEQDHNIFSPFTTELDWCVSCQAVSSS